MKRLALVTGAMQAASASLWWFYRRLATLRSVRALVDDRHQLKQRLLGSGLDVTILRPPRLTDGRASKDRNFKPHIGSWVTKEEVRGGRLDVRSSRERASEFDRRKRLKSGESTQVECACPKLCSMLGVYS